MKSTRLFSCLAILSLLLASALAQAASITGTVTDKTTGKPAAGDPVVLVRRAGRHERSRPRDHRCARPLFAGSARQRPLPGSGHPPGRRLLYRRTPGRRDRATSRSTTWPPRSRASRIEADVLEVETDNGQLKVTERYFVHNTSSPPVTQWSAHSFEVNLPAEAVIDGVGAQRPNGLPTNVKMDPDGPKGHYSFNFPIQPDDGDKDTLFQIGYHLPYSCGQLHLQIPAHPAGRQRSRAAAQEHEP